MWLYTTYRFYYALLVIIGIACLSIFWEGFYHVSIGVLILFILIILYEFSLLYNLSGKVSIVREPVLRLSNGEENTIKISIHNASFKTLESRVYDDIPVQFQLRNASWEKELLPDSDIEITYSLTPKKRGEYHFGRTRIFISLFTKFLYRRFQSEKPEAHTTVYPAYKNLELMEFLAVQNKTRIGNKKRRKLGHSMEFEQIIPYVPGDNPRHINWKAAARTGKLMTNHFSEEMDNRIFLCIDMGRHMQSPYDGMTLLDYAINSCISLAHVAFKKKDKIGLITYNEKLRSYIPAERNNSLILRMMESLYAQETNFLESSTARFYQEVNTKITHRSLLIHYTNFQSVESMRRQLPYLRKISRRHVLLCVFFKNTELNKLINTIPSNKRELFDAVIAEEMMIELYDIQSELNDYGIYTLLTEPENLRVDVINSYLEIKEIGVL